MKWSNIYCCVNFSFIKNALEHVLVHLEDEFVQNQLLIAGGLTRFNVSFIHVASQSEANLALWGLQANSHLGAPASTGLCTLYRKIKYTIQGMNKSHCPFMLVIN